MYKSLSLILASVLLTFACQGCSVMTDNQYRQQPTVGQQLIDLKAALDKGAITADEFEKKKAELLHKPA